MSEQNIEGQRNKPIISPREIIFRYIRYVPWVAISLAILLIAAFIKLRYSTPIYSISGRLLVTNQAPYSNSGEKFDDIFMMQRGDMINDEIEIIKSRSIASRVIRSLELQKQMANKGNIRSTSIHPRDMPFNFEIVKITDSASGFNVLVKILSDNEFQLNEQPTKYYFNQLIQLSSVTFRITSNNRDWRVFSSDEFVISWTPLENMAAALSRSINVNRVNDFTNVLNLSYQTENTKLGVDIVNQYIYEYQQASLEDKREIAAKTLEFIDAQLDTVFQDLGGVERNLQTYREKNRVINQDAQTQLFFNEYSETNKQLAINELSIKVTDFLTNYLADQKTRFKIITSVLGIEEPALLQQVTEFNSLQLERETALKNTAPNNPRIISMEAAIEKLRTDMLETLKHVKQTHLLAITELQRKSKEADNLINSIPSKEKRLLEVTRRQNILQELYSYLLQKKLETSIASASTISSIKTVEPAMASGAPVSPNKRALYIVAIVLGIAIPVGIIFLIEYLNDKVRSKNEIQQITNTPILGEIGHAEEASALVVTKNNRKFLAEQFRIIRSNLQYILPKVEKPIMLVTSSFSGEGKSFISTNLGSVLALSGRQTIILEFDIRKPKILKGLGLNERRGITNYIVGNIELDEIIHAVPGVENLFVMSCGPVPPNPAEMLLSERVEELFKQLRNRFDAIIIDTAPVGLVSDAITLGRFADATAYIVRHNYTLKKQVHLIDDLYRNKKLPHLSIIINDINTSGGYGGYYGYGGYGYGGYGYGFGNGDGGYFEAGTRKKLFRWFKNSSQK